MCNDKSKKCNKGTCALWVSIAALLLCLIVFGLWIFEAIPHSVVTLDSFIGTCVSVLSIIVTIAIGWQIFNVVEVKNAMKELKAKQEEVEVLKEELKKEIHNVKIEINDNKYVLLYIQALTECANALESKDFSLTCICAHTTLYYALRLTVLNPSYVNDCIQMIETSLTKIDEMDKKISLSNKLKEHLDEQIQVVKNAECYPWIKDRYERMIAEFISKVEIKEE